MQNHRKAALFTLLLSVFMLVYSASGLAAEANKYQPYAEALAPLGVFVGTDNGFELERVPTRAEGLVMLIRLLGLEKEAQALQNEPIPFTDVPAWANGYVAYAYENGLTQGTSATTFSANTPMNAKMFCTFLLRSLGYSDRNGDFSYDAAMSYAQQIGLLQTEQVKEITEATFVRGHVAKMAYDALNFPYKGGDTILLQKLVNEGKLTTEQANTFLATIVKPEEKPAFPAAPQQKPAATLKTMAELAQYANCIVRVESDTNGYLCSGIFIDGEGTFITSYGLLKDATYIQLALPDKTTYTGEIYVQDYDVELGILVLKANYKPKAYATLGDASKLQIGETVVSIGGQVLNYNNMGSGKITEITDYNIRSETLFQAGNALFNMYGELVGIQLSFREAATDSISTALPINMLSRVSEKKMLTLKEFNKLAAEVKPPTNVRVVEQTGRMVYLNWDSVPGADYYCMYMNNTNVKDSYYFYTSEENGIRPYKIFAADNSEYGFMDILYLIDPNTPCNIKITAVKDGIESDYSAALSFRKNSSFNTSNMAKRDNYYTRAPWVPDFGAIYNHELNDHLLADLGISLKGVLRYAYFTATLADVMNYVKLLEDNGFSKNDFLTNYLNSEINYTYAVSYTSKDTGRHIEIIYEEGDGLTLWIDL